MKNTHNPKEDEMKTLPNSVITRNEVTRQSTHLIIASVARQSMKRLLAIFGLLMMFVVSGWGAVLDSDTFNSTTDGWSGTGVTQELGQMRINSGNTASKTFNYPAFANQSVTLILTATKIDTWENKSGNRDRLVINLNGNEVHNSNTTGNLSFDVAFDGSGNLAVTIRPNTTDGAEDVYIDNIQLTYTSADAINDTFSSVQKDNAFVGNVLTNDSGSGNSVTAHTNPAHGTLSIVANGQFTYTPTTGYTGADSFTYTITDAGGNTDTATANITVVAPTADVGITVVATPTSAVTNGTLVYELSVKNNSTTTTVNNLVLIDTLPTNGIYQNAYGSGWNCTHASGVVTCTSPSLAKSTTSVVTVVVTAPSSTGTMSNTATVTAAETDTNSANNTVTTNTTVNTPSYTSSNYRPFTLQKTININGDMKIIGNSVMVDEDSLDPQFCAGAGIVNNDINLKYANLDPTGNYNSTSAKLKLPAGIRSSKVKFAYLYWQGRIENSGDALKGKNVKIKPFGATDYTTVSSIDPKFNWRSKEYQGVSDVTDIIKASIDKVDTSILDTIGYDKDVWVADVFAFEQPNGFGAWALAIVYEDKYATLKNISLYDGYQQVFGNTKEFTLSGFLTPSSGQVNSKFLIFGAEGDSAYDTNVDDVSLTNSTNQYVSLGKNIFNSTEQINGVNVTDRNPSCANTIGIDIDTFDIGTNGATAKIIGNDQTTTKVKLASSNDEWFPGVFAFSTDLYVPEVCYNEVITDKDGNSINGTKVKIGDILDVNVTIKNQGDEEAKGVLVEKLFEENTVLGYKAGSLKIRNISSSVANSKTDAALDDSAAYDSSNFTSKFFIGTGADATNGTGGGVIKTDENTSIYYKIEVKKYAPSTIENNYLGSYSSATLLTPILGVPLPKCTQFENSITIFNPGLFEECGYFPDALSTRNSCGNATEGKITFNGSANVIDNPDISLATCDVQTPQWVLDSTETCSKKDCRKLPGSSLSMSNLNYDNPPAGVTITNLPASLTSSDYTVASTTSQSGNEYDLIKYNWSGFGLTLSQTSDIKVNSIEMTTKDTLNIASNGIIEIGDISSSNNIGNKVFTTGTPTTIQIDKFNLANGSTVTLGAKDKFYAETVTIGRDESNMTISAKKIRINALTASNVGSGVANIIIKGDEIDIGKIDMGQGAKVTIMPYTSGGKVFVKTTDITASSSSTLLLSSGEYYTKTLNIPGMSNGSSIAVRDENQDVNFYINGSFTPGNNPGINSAGNNGNFGSLPSTTMKLLINGDLITGGGGTTLNAIVYVEGDVSLGSPSYVRGAISASEKISIEDGSKIYYDKNITGEIYSSCANSTYTIDSILDAWDETGSVSDKQIKTKIINQPFNLKLVSLNAAGDTLETFPEAIQYRLVSVTGDGDCPDIDPSATDWQNLDLSSSTSAVKAFMLPIISAAQKVQFKWDNYGTLEHRCSSDAFAVRPKAFDVTANIGPNIRAGENFIFTFKGVDPGNTSVTGYNATSDVNFDVQIAETKGAPCIVGVFNPVINTGWNLTDGQHDLTTNYSEVGQINVTMSEEPKNCPARFANVDCDDVDQSNLNIEPVTKTFDFIPNDFDVNTVVANQGNGFTYLSAALPNMSAQLQMTITARNALGAITQNYQTACYAKNTDYTVGYPAVNTTPNALTQITFDETQTNTPAVTQAIGTQFSINGLGHANLFTAATPGVANPVVRVNFDRNNAQPVNPFDFTVNQVTVTDADGVTGTQNLNAAARFYYGRVHAPEYRFTGANGNGRIYFEVFCGTGCNNALLPANHPMSDETDWFMNGAHVDPADGTVNNINGNAHVGVGAPVVIGGVNVAANGNGFIPRGFTYDASQGYPYKATMQIPGKDAWLDFNPTDFDIEFLGNASNWIGEQKNTTSTDSTATPVTNRRIMW